MDAIFNRDLILHPVNWLIIFLTLYFAAMLARVLERAVVTGDNPIPLPGLT